MRTALRIERRLMGFVTAAVAVLVGCSSGDDSSASGTTGASSTLPGNEAIPNIGTAPRIRKSASDAGGSGSGGSDPAGGTLATDPSSVVEGGSASSLGGSGATNGGSPNASGGSSTSSVGSLVSGGTNATANTTTYNPRGGQGAGTAGLGATNGSTLKGGAAGTASTAGGKSAIGGSAAGGTSDVGGSVAYHTLPNWESPAANNANHHGRRYFISNAQKDDQGIACTACHGAKFEGTSTAPACSTCHSTWQSCNFCHGASAAQTNPPRGVLDEATTATLAVGRHVAHLTGASSHQAFACNTCHVVPAANDVAHLLAYVPTTDLTTPGHHGDVTFSGTATNTTWNVNATAGTPVTARGTCIGACHSNGRGANPAKIPYWAGGSWTTGCTNCHGATGSTRSSEHGHGFPGSTCADCHVGASATAYAAATHMNGTREFRTSPGGRAAGMTMTANWNCSNVPCH